MQIMKRSNFRVPGRAFFLVAAVAIGLCLCLCLTLPAWAQLALPPVGVPQPPTKLPVPQLQPAPTVPALPSAQQTPPVVKVPALPTTPVVPGLSSVLPATAPGVLNGLPLPVSPAAAPIAVPEVPVRESGASPMAQTPAGLLPLNQLRVATVRELLRRHANVLEPDPMGEPVRRQEILWLSPKPLVLKAALALGFVVLRTQSLPELDLPELDLRTLVLRPPPGLATAQALDKLRALDPDVEADFNHLYTSSGDTGAVGAAVTSNPSNLPRRVGLVDGGVDRQHAAIRGASLHLWGCSGVSHPSAHGTAVASLLVGRETAFAGSATGTTLFAADIYCGQVAESSAEAVAQALAWMVRENVAVVNISLVGPPNRLLERAVQAMVRKGFLLVAAVGNDGPAALPLYPAAYAGVVGVTAVLPDHRVLPEAAQGSHVMFAALGAGVAVAQTGGGYKLARGTSFAAPRLAGLLAQALQVPDPQAAAAAVARLAARAVDLGAPGRDPVFGYGLVANDYK